MSRETFLSPVSGGDTGVTFAPADSLPPSRRPPVPRSRESEGPTRKLARCISARASLVINLTATRGGTR
jgi:hypothetical protein